MQRQIRKRFFLFTIFSKDNAMAKNISNYDPHDYIVAIETNIDNETSRRDLRSMYDFLDEYIGAGKERVILFDVLMVFINQVYIRRHLSKYKRMAL